MKLFLPLILFSALVLPLSACGKKPDIVTTPDGQRETEQFPRTYPAPDEDY